MIDCNGIHEVALDYCACEGTKSAKVQLLPVPSDINEPEVCGNISCYEVLSYSFLWIEMLGLQILQHTFYNVGMNASQVRIFFSTVTHLTEIF